MHSQWKKVHWLMYLLINFYTGIAIYMWVKNFGPTTMPEPYKSNNTPGISCKNAFGVKKCGQVKYNHTWKWMHEQIVDNKIWYQSTVKELSVLNTLILYMYSVHIIACYCFQDLIGPANLLSAISCYRFHILKD